MDSGVAVLNVADGGRFFIEQGKALVLDPSGTRGGGARMGVGASQTYSRTSAVATPVVVNRANPAFAESMPLPFRDTLPAMYAKAEGRAA
jgi:hypothetical protein